VFWRRLAFTLAGLAAWGGLQYVPIPGMDYGVLSPEAFSVVTFGVLPFTTAALWVEVFCAAWPSVRHLRRSGSPGHRVILWGSLVGAVLFAVAQSFTLSTWLQNEGDAHPSLGVGVTSLPLFLAGLILGSLLLTWLLLEVSERGLLHVLALAWLTQSVNSRGLGLERVPDAFESWLPFLGGLGIVAGVSWLGLRPQRRSPLLSSTVMPLLTLQGLMAALGSVLFVASPTSPLGRLSAFPFDELASPWGRLGFLVCVGLPTAALLSWLTARPSRVGQRGWFQRVLLPSLLCVASLGVADVALGKLLGVPLAATWLTLAVAILSDAGRAVMAHWRAELVAIHHEHRPYRVAELEDALTSAGVEVRVSGRVLSQYLGFLAPWYPAVLWVPVSAEAKARQLVVGLSDTAPPASPAAAVADDVESPPSAASLRALWLIALVAALLVTTL